jgi:hypothetical protein
MFGRRLRRYARRSLRRQAVRRSYPARRRTPGNPIRVIPSPPRPPGHDLQRCFDDLCPPRFTNCLRAGRDRACAARARRVITLLPHPSGGMIIP